ncbi:MAG TPA: VWA domain-containing protein [Vicinamibacterales bacterium]|jgi:Ca-activated chloride channel family protein
MVTRGSFITICALGVLIFTAEARPTAVQDQPVASFKAGVDLVRVSAVVRDRKGRFVQDLSAHDFEILDGGLKRSITDFRNDQSGVSIALLFDVSGSMEAKLPKAREAADHVLSWLNPKSDEAAVFTFDTRLDQITPFTSGLKTLPAAMANLTPFGATSLRDAIAQTAERVGGREGRRRAVVVLTDGNDNASRLEPGEVASIASAIDVPVYIFGIVASIDNPAEDIATSSADHSALSGPLADLSARTGGHVFTSSTPGQRSIAARQIVDELRHQYLIAFESSGKPGWHPLVVRARDKDLTVRARSGYIAGQSRPNS